MFAAVREAHEGFHQSEESPLIDLNGVEAAMAGTTAGGRPLMLAQYSQETTESEKGRQLLAALDDEEEDDDDDDATLLDSPQEAAAPQPNQSPCKTYFETHGGNNPAILMAMAIGLAGKHPEGGF